MRILRSKTHIRSLLLLSFLWTWFKEWKKAICFGVTLQTLGWEGCENYCSIFILNLNFLMLSHLWSLQENFCKIWSSLLKNVVLLFYEAYNKHKIAKALQTLMFAFQQMQKSLPNLINIHAGSQHVETARTRHTTYGRQQMSLLIERSKGYLQVSREALWWPRWTALRDTWNLWQPSFPVSPFLSARASREGQCWRVYWGWGKILRLQASPLKEDDPVEAIHQQSPLPTKLQNPGRPRSTQAGQWEIHNAQEADEMIYARSPFRSRGHYSCFSRINHVVSTALSPGLRWTLMPF